MTVEPAIPLRHRAFLSYAHADRRIVERLHRALERTRIDPDLIGRMTPLGPVPANLRPIFRDRDDFTGGHSLTDATLAALDASAALIVACTPAAAQSRYVDEEVRLFRYRHPTRPVIPVIVAGAYPDNFPLALRFELDAAGQVTEHPVTILGPDLQETGDGFGLGLAKLVAGLTGVASDDIYRRAERARRRSANVRNGIIAVLALLVVAAGASAWLFREELKRNEALLEATLKTTTEIVNTAVAQAEKYNVPRTATLEMLSRAEALFDHMSRLGRPTPALQRQKAWMLIEFARNYAILGNTTKQRESADAAHRIMAALAEGQAGDTTAQRNLSVAHNERGKVLQAQGNLPAALDAFKASLAIAMSLAKADPGNAGWQRDLSVSHDKIGRVLEGAGRVDEAMVHYAADLAIAERLAALDPGNATWTKDVEISRKRMERLRRR